MGIRWRELKKASTDTDMLDKNTITNSAKYFQLTSFDYSITNAYRQQKWQISGIRDYNSTADCCFALYVNIYFLNLLASQSLLCSGYQLCCIAYLHNTTLHSQFPSLPRLFLQRFHHPFDPRTIVFRCRI